jgi:hypothetical protein
MSSTNCHDDAQSAYDVHLQKQKREKFRAQLIKNFEVEQAKTRAFVSFPEIAKHWAPRRAELTLKAARAAAIEDLMEAAYDGHFPSMLFLRPQTGVEYVPEVCENLSQWLEKNSLPDERTQDGDSARLDHATLNQMRGMSGLRDLRDRYLLDQVAPFLWIASELAVSLLRKRGVDPGAWAEWSVGMLSQAPAQQAEANGTEKVVRSAPDLHEVIFPKEGNGRASRALSAALREAFPGGVPQDALLPFIRNKIAGTAAFKTRGLDSQKLKNGSYDTTLKRLLGRTKK